MIISIKNNTATRIPVSANILPAVNIFLSSIIINRNTLVIMIMTDMYHLPSAPIPFLY